MIKNIGWTLGNDCPCKCRHCYSFSVRQKGQNLTKEIVDRVIEQIEKLKQQNLIIEDEDFAKKYLEIFGYFNLIKGYRSPYIFTDASGLHYRSGITFNQILSLYMFDKNLRNAVIASMLDLEEHIKASAADVVAQSFGTHQDDYLNIRNYRDKKMKKLYNIKI